MKREDLKSLSTKELLKKRKEAEFGFAQFNGLQKVRKVQLNSCYGALGNRYFRMYDIRLAESVTHSGQFVIKWVDTEINKAFNKAFGTDEDYVVFAHTDSMYIRLDRVVERLFPKGEPEDPREVVSKLVDFCKKQIYPQINKIFERLSHYLNAFENKMNMKIEVVADRGVWDGKNRYVLNVYYDEGVVLNHPVLKMVGIETVKSSIPAVCRKRLTQAIEIIMRKNVDDLRVFILDTKDEFMNVPVEDISISTSVKGMEQYDPRFSYKVGDEVYDDANHDPTVPYRSRKAISQKTGRAITVGCARHIKAALIHNFLIDKRKLDKEYQKIKNGDKIKFVALLPENPISEDVIGYKDHLPDEFGVRDYVDREYMFDVTFMKPIEKIAHRAGWLIKEVVTIDQFFN